MADPIHLQSGILLTGARGQLGLEMQRILPKEQLWATDVPELDITDQHAVRRFFELNKVGLCINAAGYTAVDKAEAEPELAMRINAHGPHYLAEACQRSGAVMLHISTDFVFDGKAKRPYTSSDAPAPLSVYGMTKAEGESRVLQACERAIVLRTSWLYSQWGANFVKTMMRLGAERAELGVVDDQHGCPTWARDLAHAIRRVVQDELHPEDYGIYHYSNSGQTTWCGLATAVMDMAGLDCQVKPIATADYPTPAARPAWSVMDCSRIRERFGLAIPAWKDSLRECLTLLLNTPTHA